MNTKNNQRYKATETLLMGTLMELIEQKEISRITVRDICDASQINRSTFYAHFENIADMLKKMDVQMRKELVFSFPSDNYKQLYESGAFLIPFLTFVKKHQAFYHACLTERTDFPIADGYDSLMNLVVRPICQDVGITSEQQIYYSLTFYQAGFTMVLKNWVSNGCKDSIDDIARYLKTCMKFPLEK